MTEEQRKFLKETLDNYLKTVRVDDDVFMISSDCIAEIVGEISLDDSLYNDFFVRPFIKKYSPDDYARVRAELDATEPFDPNRTFEFGEIVDYIQITRMIMALPSDDEKKKYLDRIFPLPDQMPDVIPEREYENALSCLINSRKNIRLSMEEITEEEVLKIIDSLPASYFIYAEYDTAFNALKTLQGKLKLFFKAGENNIRTFVELICSLSDEEKKTAIEDYIKGSLEGDLIAEDDEIVKEIKVQDRERSITIFQYKSGKIKVDGLNLNEVYLIIAHLSPTIENDNLKMLNCTSLLLTDDVDGPRMRNMRANFVAGLSSIPENDRIKEKYIKEWIEKKRINGVILGKLVGSMSGTFNEKFERLKEIFEEIDDPREKVLAFGMLLIETRKRACYKISYDKEKLDDWWNHDTMDWGEYSSFIEIDD